jgi:hypothetical protein
MVTVLTIWFNIKQLDVSSTTFVRFVLLSEQTFIFHINVINRVIFVMKMRSVSDT